MPDQLYQAAFAFRSAKLWKKLSSTQLFTIKLSDGRIGYCSVMGHNGEHRALRLYLGESGFRGFEQLVRWSDDIFPEQHFEAMTSLDCLQCSFENKEDMLPAEVKSVQAYVKAHHLRLRGAHSFPSLLRTKPDSVPWVFAEPEEYNLMHEALLAALDVSEKLQRKPEELGFTEFLDGSRQMPLLIPEGDSFVWNTCVVPKLPPEKLPSPIPNNETIQKMNQLDRVNVWECELIYFPSPVQDSPEEAPYFPCLLLAADIRAHYLLQLQPSRKYRENAESILQNFTEEILRYGKAPQIISVRDNRTEQLLKPLCTACCILIKNVEEFTYLDDIKTDLIAEAYDDSDNEEYQLESMIEMLSQLSEEELRAVPPEVKDSTVHLAEMGLFPEEILEKLKQAWNF